MHLTSSSNVQIHICKLECRCCIQTTIYSKKLIAFVSQIYFCLSATSSVNGEMYSPSREIGDRWHVYVIHDTMQCCWVVTTFIVHLCLAVPPRAWPLERGNLCGSTVGADNIIWRRTPLIYINSNDDEYYQTMILHIYSNIVYIAEQRWPVVGWSEAAFLFSPQRS